MSETDPVRVLCIYRVKNGHETEFRSLLEKHWRTLDGLGLVTATPATWYRTEDQQKRTCFVEIFEWKDGATPKRAHEIPEVMAIWEPMGTHAEEMEFLDIEAVA